MSPLVSSVNQILSLLTITGQAIIVLVLINNLRFTKSSEIKADFVNQLINKNVVLLSFIIALIATLGSLFYSEIAGFEPCKLCWFQRILMYPQVVLLGLALFRKDKNIIIYTLWLSLIGAAIALYHYLLQIGVAPNLSCSVTGYSAHCSQRFVMNFGYITIPMMAFTAFSMVSVLFLIKKRGVVEPRSAQ